MQTLDKPKVEAIYKKYSHILPKLEFTDNNNPNKLDFNLNVSHVNIVKEYINIKYDGFDLLIPDLHEISRLFMVEQEAQLQFYCLDHYINNYNPNLNIIVDLGAHIGTFSLSAIRRGANRVYAYEPHMINYFNLLSNIGINNLLHKIICLPLAVTNSCQEYYIFECKDKNSSGQASLVFWQDQNKSIVPSVNFSSIINYEISYLKIDIEGSEYVIFNKQDIDSGKLKNIRNVQCIELETHKLEDHTPETIYNFLWDNGYKDDCEMRLWVRT